MPKSRQQRNIWRGFRRNRLAAGEVEAPVSGYTATLTGEDKANLSPSDPVAGMIGYTVAEGYDIHTPDSKGLTAAIPAYADGSVNCDTAALEKEITVQITASAFSARRHNPRAESRLPPARSVSRGKLYPLFRGDRTRNP